MVITENPKKIAAQACPLCNQLQDVIINGWEVDKDDPKIVHNMEDKGYSFCNCRNIFFTDWKNINQGTYDPEYYKKYQAPNINKAYRVTAERFVPSIRKYFDERSGKHVRHVLEIGSINPTTLDVFKENRFYTLGMDIYEHPLEGHNLRVADFEKSFFAHEKFDVIWASHVFEHFKDPIAAVNKCADLLSSPVGQGGILYIAMPDPWFIDFANPYLWGHWPVNEHHIMWDMESFAEVLKEHGFEIIKMGHNTNVDQICLCDFYIVARKT